MGEEVTVPTEGQEWNGKEVENAIKYDDGSYGVSYVDGTNEIVSVDSIKKNEKADTVTEESVSYIGGNKFNPVVVLGNDPGNNKNVLVAHFSRVESVPAVTVGPEETPAKDGD